MVEVFVNNVKLDVQDQKIKYVKQVNDFADLSNLKASYTYSIRIPKTERNVRILNSLSYTRNQCDIISNGNYILRAGFCIVMAEEEDEYKIAFQSGIVDFVNLIKDKTVGSDLGLEEFNHVKTEQNIISTFDNVDGYKYLIADYGGDFGDAFGINPNYQIPSINVQTIMDRIQNLTNYTFNGFPDLSTTWFTFPTPPQKEDDTTVTIYNGYAHPGTFPNTNPILNFYWNVDVFDPQYITYGSGKFTFLQTNTYEYTVELNDSTAVYILNSGIFSASEMMALPTGTMIILPMKVYMLDPQGMIIGDLTSNRRTPLTGTITKESGWYFRFAVFPPDRQELREILEDLNYPPWSWERILNAFDLGNYKKGNLTVGEFTLNILRTAEQTYDFTQSLKDLTILEFLKDIMFRKSLTAFIDPERRIIDFKTLDERLDTRDAYIFRGRITKTKSRSYTLGNYAKKNLLINQKDEDDLVDDGVLFVGNDNLKETEILFTSIFFQPQINTSLGFLRMNLWNQQVKETSSGIEITYKALSNRFYLITEEWVNQSITIGETTVMGYPKAISGNNSLPLVVAEFYSKWNLIFDQPLIEELETVISDFHISQMELDKPFFVKEKDAFYILNRIIYDSGDKSIAEFIKITM